MKNTIKIYVVTVLCTALAVPAHLQGAAAPQKLEEFHLYENLPLDMQREIVARFAQPLINYIYNYYVFTLKKILKNNRPIINIEFSPDGTKIAATKAGGIVKIFNAQNGHELFVLEQIQNVQFSSDGKQIVSTNLLDDNATIWNAQTGHKLLTLAGHTRPILSTAFNPKGNLIVTTSADDTAIIWNAQTGLPLHQLAGPNGHTQRINTAQFSPKDNLIVTASWDRTAKTWDTNGNLLHTLDGQNGHTDGISTAQFSPKGNLIVTASWDHTAKIWDTDGNLLHTLDGQNGHTDAIKTARFNPKGNFIITASADKTVKIWDTNGNLLHTLAEPDGHTQPINNAQFSPDGNLILTTCNDSVKIWNAQFSPNETSIATALNNNTAKIWEPQQQFINWIKNYATLNQISYLSSTLHIPGAASHTFNENQIKLLFSNKQKTGFTQTMPSDVYNFLTDELGIKNPTSQTSESEIEQSEEID